jgi:hypothetical protein
MASLWYDKAVELKKMTSELPISTANMKQCEVCEMEGF